MSGGKRCGYKTPEERERRAQKIAQRKVQGWRCFYCRRPFTEARPFTFDHYIPYRIWRTTQLKNLVLACGPCNEAKADRLPWTVALLLLKRVRENELWRLACAPANPALYGPAA
ncbi:HNH endonuclease [Streptomyces noursei]|uniref:HNH endonuclease n=1 Tax=Streptomyces noursei TaxID=1971 RepID=UPI0035D91264